MGDLTANLSAVEFSCRCKYPDCTHKLVADMRLALTIQEAADYFKAKYHASKVSVDKSVSVTLQTSAATEWAFLFYYVA